MHEVVSKLVPLPSPYQTCRENLNRCLKLLRKVEAADANDDFDRLDIGEISNVLNELDPDRSSR